MNTLILLLGPKDSLPEILKALKPSGRDEVLAVGPKALLPAADGNPKVRLLETDSANLAEKLNFAVRESKGDQLLFLGPGCFPAAGWVKAMEKALKACDLAVGETSPAPSPQAGDFERLSASLYQGHSKRAASAQGYAFPWGPLYNLAVKRDLLNKAGPFSAAAGGAVDMDWCWRAVLSGGEIAFAPQAKAKRKKAVSREQALLEFEAFGANEVWLQRTYGFLTGEMEFQIPALAAIDAYHRLKYGSKAAKKAALQPALEEAAVAFAGGLRAALSQAHRACSLERKAPAKAISWKDFSGRGEVIFVPGKGITELRGKPLELWRAYRKGAGKPALEKLFQKLFRATAEEAKHGLEDFLHSLGPV